MPELFHYAFVDANRQTTLISARTRCLAKPGEVQAPQVVYHNSYRSVLDPICIANGAY
jgi:hypothetical protein